MKAEHRKELQTNVLADTMGRFLQGVKEGPSRNALLIPAVLALVVGAFFLGRWLYRSSQETRSELWLKVEEGDRSLVAASDLGQVDEELKKLRQIAEEHPGTVPARVMQFTRARTLLRLGLERLFSDLDREKALNQITEARELYVKLASESSESPVLVQEALMGAAKAREALGEVEEALEEYKKLAARYPDSALGKAAKERAEFLDNPQNRKQVKELDDALKKLIGDRPKTSNP